jgi:hypothetical protein
MSAHLAEVVTLYDTNASDIPAMLRQAADTIEAGEVRTAAVCVMLTEDGQPDIYGWGKIDSPQAIYMLQLGLAKMLRDILEPPE